MSLNLEKVMRIVNDLVGFCHSEGGEEFQIFIKHDQGCSSLTISSPIKGLAPDLVEELSYELNLPRQHEIEQSYWELSGEAELSGELSLVGMMIDEAKVGYRDGILYIHAIRKDQ